MGPFKRVSLMKGAYHRHCLTMFSRVVARSTELLKHFVRLKIFRSLQVLETNLAASTSNHFVFLVSGAHFDGLYFIFNHNVSALTTCALSTSGTYCKPRWPLSVPLNDPLPFVGLCCFLPLIKHDRLHCRGIKWPSFLLLNLCTYNGSFMHNLLVAVGTQHVLQFQVATYLANFYVVLNFF